MRTLLINRITMRMRELIDFTLMYPGTWEQVKDEFEFLKRRLDVLSADDQ